MDFECRPRTLGWLEDRRFTMHRSRTSAATALGRYSAKKMHKPINFFCHAPLATAVAVVGDFNDWNPSSNPMRQGPDGAWHVQVSLNHGHHRYVFLVDGVANLDPRAQGISRNDKNERVSLMAVS